MFTFIDKSLRYFVPLDVRKNYIRLTNSCETFRTVHNLLPLGQIQYCGFSHQKKYHLGNIAFLFKNINIMYKFNHF